MKRLIAIITLLPLLAAQVINTGNHRKIFTGGASPAAPCAKTTSSITGDYWAGSYSSSPITTNWTDQSTFNNPQAPLGSPTWSSSTFGAGYSGVTLNGTSQYFGATNSQFPNISFSNASGYAVITMPSSGGGSLSGNHNNNAMAWNVTQSGTVSLIGQPSTTFCTTTTTFTAGQSYEVAFTLSSSTCTFYVNGTQIFTTSASPGSVIGMDRLLTATQSSGDFKGSVYEIAITGTSTYDPAIHTCWVGQGLP